MKPNLQNISESQAQRFVDEDMARFSGYGMDDKYLLIFSQTQNLYTKRGKNYILLKENFTGQGIDEQKM